MQILTDYLKKHDFTVQMGTPNLPTAFVATYTKSSGGPHLGVITEYDALRGTKGAFHGDQHSTQGPIGIAAAIAIAEYLDEDEDTGNRGGVRRARRRDDAAQCEDGDVRVEGVRRHGRARAKPFDAARRVVPRQASARAA